MQDRRLATRSLGFGAPLLGLVLAGVPGGHGLAAAEAAGPQSEAQESASAIRTPWGDPDLQGVWDFRTITPLERPAEMATRSS